jgi:hypothetical protein
MNNKNTLHQENLEPTNIISRTNSLLNRDEARYIYELAGRAHLSGVMIHVGISDLGVLCCLAGSAKKCGGKVIALDLQKGMQVSHDEDFPENQQIPYRLAKNEFGLDNYIDYREVDSDWFSSNESDEIDLLFIEGCEVGEPILWTIAEWKSFVRVGGTIIFNNANKRGQVDRVIDGTLAKDPTFVEIPSVGTIRGFRKHSGKLEMILCSGLQSGGTTLVSWCFLQRPDVSGILDMWTEVIQLMPYMDTQLGWCKMTTSCFRWEDVADLFCDQGWVVKPLLIVRDVRFAYSSLRTKPYGLNGVTAEDPPLRVRFRRFLRDWEQFEARSWPIIRFESFLADPVVTLKACCKQLGIPWHEDMITWPKSREDINGIEQSNETFRTSLGGEGLKETIRPDKQLTELRGISQDDLQWLEETFCEYNRQNDYPLHLEPADDIFLSDRPSWFVTKRYEQAQERSELKRRFVRCNKSLQAIMDSKSWRLTAPLRRVYDLLASNRLKKRN